MDSCNAASCKFMSGSVSDPAEAGGRPASALDKCIVSDFEDETNIGSVLIISICKISNLGSQIPEPVLVTLGGMGGVRH